MNIDRDEFYDSEILLHKPKVKKKKPPKSKHKHAYTNCVYEIVSDCARFDVAHGFQPGIKLKIGTYCSICGKIGTFCDDKNPKWYNDDWNYHCTPTEDAKNEFSEETRTLPTFMVSDYFQKYIDLEQ